MVRKAKEAEGRLQKLLDAQEKEQEAGRKVSETANKPAKKETAKKEAAKKTARTRGTQK